MIVLNSPKIKKVVYYEGTSSNRTTVTSYCIANYVSNSPPDRKPKSEIEEWLCSHKSDTKSMETVRMRQRYNKKPCNSMLTVIRNNVERDTAINNLKKEAEQKLKVKKALALLLSGMVDEDDIEVKEFLNGFDFSHMFNKMS